MHVLKSLSPLMQLSVYCFLGYEILLVENLHASNLNHYDYAHRKNNLYGRNSFVVFGELYDVFFNQTCSKLMESLTI